MIQDFFNLILLFLLLFWLSRLKNGKIYVTLIIVIICIYWFLDLFIDYILDK